MRIELSTVAACLAASLFSVSLSTAQSVVGSVVTSGEGCPNQRIEPIYEIFPSGSFDLANTALTFAPNAAGFYDVVSGGALLPFGAAAGSFDVYAADDAIRGPLFLGFPFTYFGGNGTTMAVDVAPNGYIYLEPGSIIDTRCCNGTGNLNDFLNQTPSIAALGTDLNPSTQGTIWFNQSPGVTYITWDDVIEETGPTGTGMGNTFQVQLFPGGVFTLAYGNSGAQTDDAIVGYSNGGGANDNGGTDISMALPITFTGPLGSPPELSSGLVPTVGQPFSIDVDTLPPSTAVGALLLGLAPLSVDLGIIGAQTCDLLTDARLGSLPFMLTGQTGTASLGTTTDPNFVGASLVVQGAFIAPGTTTLGVVTSDRATLTYGNTAPVIVRASGTNNFNAVATSGFWTVNNTGPLDITGVQFDFAAPALPSNPLFDVDQTGMADRFDGAPMSTALTCGNTYRNGSDVTTGLVYMGTSTSGCDPALTTGWIGSNPGTVATTFQTLDFTFTSFGPGDVFEVDIDTDGGLTAGDDMAGMAVTITFIDGSTRTGTLVASGIDTSEAIL